VVVDVAGAEVSIDDVPVGISPLRDPVLVNAGKRRIVVTAPNVAPEARVVDVAGEDTVTAALTLHLVRPAPRELAPLVAVPRPSLRRRPRAAEPVAHRRTWPIVVCWTTTGLVAAGSAMAGLMALKASQDQRDLRDSYPVTLDELAEAQRRTRNAALLTDGLLAGTALFTALSLYVTLSGSGENTTLSVGPGSLRLSGRF
jgi:hypothetical protein